MVSTELVIPASLTGEGPHMSIEVINDTEAARLEAEVEKLDHQIDDLMKNSMGNLQTEMDADVRNLRERVEKLQEEIRSRLTPMDRVRNARHLDRPYTLEFAN